MNVKSKQVISKESIQAVLVSILKDMTADWDMEVDEAIGSQTRLVGDLQFESIDIVQFIVAIEEHFKLRGLPWEKFLMTDGRYKDEILVADTVDFLDRNLAGG